MMHYPVYIFLLVSQLVMAQEKPVSTVHTYTGTVANYPVSLTLTTYDNLAYGMLIYKKSGKPIQVVGTAEKGKLHLNEYEEQAIITGIFDGKVTVGWYTGTWYNPLKKENSRPVSLTQISEKTIPSSGSPNLTGTYAYKYPRDAGNGVIEVQQVGNNTIQIGMVAVMGPPGYNQALVQKTTLTLKNNQAFYSPEDYKNCTLKITFSDVGINLVYVGQSHECGFGLNASVVGSYVRISNKKPDFADF